MTSPEAPDMTRSTEPVQPPARRSGYSHALTVAIAVLTASACGRNRPPTPPQGSPLPVRSTTATASATGTFEVKLIPQPADAYADGAFLGRMTIDKEFRGDLVGTSKGQMLSAMSPIKGSAGYVAIERVTATLGGRRGSFVLQHSGTMGGGTSTLAVMVVPDSGTEGLTGLTGSMTIDVAGGRHAYQFTYSLPATP